MPKNVLPAAARVLPKAGQQLWLKTFNEALDQGMPEDEASKFAWAAVKRSGYSKDSSTGKWSKSMEYDFVMNDDGTFVIGAPLMKVDVKNRTIEGFATLNNIDESADIVEADASVAAFNEWFGNIREMHQKIAVGKAIDWRPDTFTDPDTGEDFEGVWVRAKISKGAEDTWQKVLDGTLSGFSIGGATQEKVRDLVKIAGGGTRQVWRITKYKLTELSLVDSPCNRLATISLIKSVDGSPQVEDTIADGDIEKAYNGETGEFVSLEGAYKGVVTALESLRDEAIRNNADSVVSRASDTLCNFRSSQKYEAMEAEYQSQVTKSDELITKENAVSEKTETLHENGESDTSISDALTEDDKSVFRKFIDFVNGNKSNDGNATAEETAELNKSKEGETPEMNEEEIAKAIDDKLVESNGELEKSIDGKFEQVGTSLEKIVAALEKVAKADEVEEIKKDLASQIEGLVTRLEVVENSGAVKKSGEDAGEGAGEKIEKTDEGLWSGSILPEFLVK